MLIPASKSLFLETWFYRYTRFYIQRSFHTVHLLGEPPNFSLVSPNGDPAVASPAPPIPLLVCVNHSSWWDVLIGLLAERELFGWEWYAAMDARQLQRYKFFSKLGVIGVDRTELQGARQFLTYSTDLLKAQRRALWLTPQGAMLSNYARPITFQPGIAHLAERLGTVYLAHVALHYEFWDERLPEAFISVSPPRYIDLSSRSWNRRAFLKEEEQNMQRQLDDLIDVVKTRNASRFRPLLQGSVGISPVYDTIRALGARLRGERFTAAHGDVRTPQWRSSQIESSQIESSQIESSQRKHETLHSEIRQPTEDRAKDSDEKYQNDRD